VGRYDIAGNAEAEYQPNSGDQVLRNRLGITSRQILRRRETLGFAMAQAWILGWVAEHSKTPPSIGLIKEIHGIALGPLYDWAGRWRTVQISSPSLPWPRAQYLEPAMLEYERVYLKTWAPGRPGTDVANALAETHGELIAIHPFRDGNGRTARLLSDLMTRQAGLGGLSNAFLARHKRRYFSSIRSVVHRKDYRPLANLFSAALFAQTRTPLPRRR